MTVEQMRQAWTAEPFQKFIIHLADGRRIPVRHREFMAMSPSGRTAIVYQSDDSFNVVDLPLVTDLHIGGNGNSHGRGRRRR
jgi:hypothetical protein